MFKLQSLFTSAIVGSLFVTLGSVSAEELQICRYCDGDLAAISFDPPTPGRKYAPDRLVDMLHVKLDVTPNFDNATVAGTATLTFVPISKPLSELRLDAVRLAIDEVTGTAPIADFVVSDDALTIQFTDPIPVGQETSVTVRYSAQPVKGLYFRTAKMGYPEEDTHVWTQGETHEARHWFPCFDYPNERSSTEVICHVPKEMTVLSNGRKVSEEVDESTGLKAVHWLQEKPHVSYLLCLVAGHYKKLEAMHRDVPLGFYAQPTLADHAHNSFQDTPTIMAFYEEEIGVPFPWEKYDQVTIRDFVAGGMENTTLTTLTHRTIYSDASENIRSSRSLDAHEMAHQWFGDYVTCKDWSHLWLNEGFATYYAHLYDGHKLGRNELLYGLYRDANDRVLSQDKDFRPIVYNNYAQAGEQFDFRAYPKGSWVLHMLRSQLGEELYRKAIKTYLERNALSSVVTEDLNAVLEEVSGRSLDRFFDQWVYHGGFPILKITYRWIPADKLAHIHVEQTQEVNDQVLMFELPATLRFHVGKKVIDREVTINDKEHDFYVPLSAQPKIVRFDPEYTLLAKVEFKPPRKMLLAQLANEDDMIGRLLAIEALADSKDHKVLEALKVALQKDPFYGVRIAAAKAIAKLHTDEAFEALQASREQEDAHVRLAVIEGIGSFYRPETLETLCTVAEEEKNPAIVAAAVKSLAKFSEPKAAHCIETALNRESFGNEIAVAAIEAIRQAHNTELTDELLMALMGQEKKFDSSDFGSGLNAVAALSEDQEDKSATRKFLANYLDHPREPVQVAAIRALGALGDRQALPVLQPLTDAHSGRISTAAKDAVSAIEQEAATAPEEVRELRKLVRELQDEQKKLGETVEELQGKGEAKEEKTDAAEEATEK